MKVGDEEISLISRLLALGGQNDVLKFQVTKK